MASTSARKDKKSSEDPSEKFSVGDLVFVTIPHFKWPAIISVSEQSKSGQYKKLENDQWTFHLYFIEQEPTFSWIGANFLELWDEVPQKELSEGGKFYSKSSDWLVSMRLARDIYVSKTPEKRIETIKNVIEDIFRNGSPADALKKKKANTKKEENPKKRKSAAGKEKSPKRAKMENSNGPSTSKEEEAQTKDKKSSPVKKLIKEEPKAESKTSKTLRSSKK